MREIRLPTKARLTSELVPDIQLAHGRAVWVLAAMGFGAGTSTATFNHYIKSLRKLGLPFATGEFGTRVGRPARYSFNHLMELCLALTLRIYGTIPDALLRGIIEFRRELHAHYRHAYLEFDSGLGAPIRLASDDQPALAMQGVYLDLRIRFAGGRALDFGPPRVISPREAVQLFADLETPGRAHLPFNLSDLAIRLVECAERSPNIRRGPHHPSGHV